MDRSIKIQLSCDPNQFFNSICETGNQSTIGINSLDKTTIIWSNEFMDPLNKSEIECLAQQLYRPVMSLKAFSQMSDRDLAWLNQKLSEAMQNEEKKMNQSLYQTPFFLRWLFKQK